LGGDSKDIYSLLEETEEKKRLKLRGEILCTIGVGEEYFEEGSVKIDKTICRGAECKLCIKACPTHALYWEVGEVKLEKDLCIYCAACVLSCIVDDCIKVNRKRKDGEIETFSTPREVTMNIGQQAAHKRAKATKALLKGLSKTKPTR